MPLLPIPLRESDFMRPLRLLGFVLLLPCTVALLGCRQIAATIPAEDETGPAWFADVTEEVGLHFIHDAGAVPSAHQTGSYFMPQIFGSGVAVFDFNNDGLLDIYLLQNGGPNSGKKNKLFQQLQDGTFKDVSESSGLDIEGYNMGVAIGDVNNDGWPDVLVTQFGGIKLFLNNNGNGTFTDLTAAAGLKNPGWATSAAFVDYNRDGWLDLVVTNYLDYDPSWPCSSATGAADYCSPKTFTGCVTRLFRNLGQAQGVKFEDATISSGLGARTGPGLGVFCSDFNGDGWPDIFIANDGQPNHLWINHDGKNFTEEAVLRGVAYNHMGLAWANMGIAYGDVDGNGLPALFVTHVTEETNTLWKQGPRGKFRDQTALSGLASPKWSATGFGTAMGDFANQGVLDIAVVNGRVARGPPANAGALGPHWSKYGERNQLFANDGNGYFRDVSPQNSAFCGAANVARGLAVGDLFNDGGLDMVITTIGGPARVYRNVAPQRGHWLSVRALDPALKRDAYGVEVRIEQGGKRWQRQIDAGGSYLSSSDPRAHFGLGTVERVDTIHVLWPDGRKEDFACGQVDRLIVLKKGDGTGVNK
jgi:hypothetical protein